MWLHDYNADQDNPLKEDPFFEIAHMSYVDNIPAWTYPWHEHSHEYEISFIMEGEGSLVVGSTSFAVKAGTVAIISPGVSHHYSSDGTEPMPYYTIRIKEKETAEGLQAFLRELGNATAEAGGYQEYLDNTIQVLFNIHHANGGYADEAFQSVALGLMQVLKMMFQDNSMSLQLSEKYSVSDVLDYIQLNKGEKITLESLAYHFNISASHLSRVFTAAYHMSPINYLIFSRITYATELLLKTNLSVVDIAQGVGYDNPAHFTNMFIKRIGCSPSEYRERNGKNPGKGIQ